MEHFCWGLKVCVSLGCIAFRNQEAIPCAVTQIPPRQRRGWGHVHEDRQSLRRVSVVHFWSGWGTHLYSQWCDKSVWGEWLISLWSPSASPTKSPVRIGKYTVTRTDREVSDDAFEFICLSMMKCSVHDHSDSWMHALNKRIQFRKALIPARANTKTGSLGISDTCV